MLKNGDVYLVRFGGAGAVLPFLFVVRRICTFTLLPPVENVDNFDDADPCSLKKNKVFLNDKNNRSLFNSFICNATFFFYLMNWFYFRNVCSFETFYPSMVLNLNANFLVIVFRLLQLLKIPVIDPSKMVLDKTPNHCLS